MSPERQIDKVLGFVHGTVLQSLQEETYLTEESPDLSFLDEHFTTLAQSLKSYGQRHHENSDTEEVVLFLPRFITGLNLHSLTANIDAMCTLLGRDISPQAILVARKIFRSDRYSHLFGYHRNTYYVVLRDALVDAHEALDLDGIYGAPVEIFEELLTDRLVEAFDPMR